MLAKRKSDGKVIEVTEKSSWNKEKIYTADGIFYHKEELDFSVNETKEAEGEVLNGWVARDKKRQHLKSSCRRAVSDTEWLSTRR